MTRSFLRLEACPRCKGEILVDKAFENSDVCLQCGFRGWRRPAYQAQFPDREEKKGKQALKETVKLIARL